MDYGKKLKLGDVQETALIPLSNRATETLRKNPRVRDPKAVQVINELCITTKKYDKTITHECVIARTIMFDDTVKSFIERYPNALCLNIGCGLDDRFNRVDNGHILWYDIDLKDSIAVRNKIFENTDRRKMVVGSVLETEWYKHIFDSDNEARKVLVIAEGLLIYFSKEDNQKILKNIVSLSPHGTFIVEMMRPSTMDEKKHDTVKETNAKFGWGTTSGHEFEQLEPKMKLVSEHSFSEQMMKSTLISRIIGLVSKKINNRIAIFEW
ncbi:MAG: class I SAM-dependent methyltransferase [Erysipelotrichaceae bacterium]|nr:class I SAM-dependent methyltransferase [Erysipelotrichaceae bacterium]